MSFYESQHLCALWQRRAQGLSQHAGTFAMHDSHALQPAGFRFIQEIAQHLPGLHSIQAVKIELVLDAPVTAAQLAQNLGRVAVP